MNDFWSWIVGGLILTIPVLAIGVWILFLGFVVRDRFGWFRPTKKDQS